jgi:hypothetical protein
MSQSLRIFSFFIAVMSLASSVAYAQNLPDAPGSPSYTLKADFLGNSFGRTTAATYTFWRQTLTNNKSYNLVRVTPDAGKDMFFCPSTFFSVVLDSTVQRTEFHPGTNSGDISCETISGPKTYILSLGQAPVANIGVDRTLTFRVKSQAGGASDTVASLIIPSAGTPAGNGATVFNYSDAWYVPAESGWGILISHHVDTGGGIFAPFFVYGDNGTSAWYFISGGTWSGNTFTGDISQTTAAPGGIAALAGFDPARVKVTKAGTASILFTSRDSATLTYTINGVTGSKNIVRIGF